MSIRKLRKCNKLPYSINRPYPNDNGGRVMHTCLLDTSEINNNVINSFSIRDTVHPYDEMRQGFPNLSPILCNISTPCISDLNDTTEVGGTSHKVSNLTISTISFSQETPHPYDLSTPALSEVGDIEVNENVDSEDLNRKSEFIFLCSLLCCHILATSLYIAMCTPPSIPDLNETPPQLEDETSDILISSQLSGVTVALDKKSFRDI